MRTRAQQNMHIFRLTERKKCVQIVIRIDLSKVKLSAGYFVNAPRHVRADRLKTHLTDAIKDLAPS